MFTTFGTLCAQAKPTFDSVSQPIKIMLIEDNAEPDEHPDLILLDLNLPRMSDQSAPLELEQISQQRSQQQVKHI